MLSLVDLTRPDRWVTRLNYARTGAVVLRPPAGPPWVTRFDFDTHAMAKACSRTHAGALSIYIAYIWINKVNIYTYILNRYNTRSQRTKTLGRSWDGHVDGRVGAMWPEKRTALGEEDRALSLLLVACTAEESVGLN